MQVEIVRHNDGAEQTNSQSELSGAAVTAPRYEDTLEKLWLARLSYDVLYTQQQTYSYTCYARFSRKYEWSTATVAAAAINSRF